MPRPRVPRRHRVGAGRTGSRACRTGFAASRAARAQMWSHGPRIVRWADEPTRSRSPLPAPVTAVRPRPARLPAWTCSRRRRSAPASPATTWSTTAGRTCPRRAGVARLAMLDRHAAARGGARRGAAHARRAHRPGHPRGADRAGPLLATRSCATRPGTRSTVVYLLGSGLFGLSPVTTRPGPSVARPSLPRVEGLPAVLAGRHRGAHGPARPSGLAAPPGHGAGPAVGHRRPRRRGAGRGPHPGGGRRGAGAGRAHRGSRRDGQGRPGASSAPTSTRTSAPGHRARAAWAPSCSPRSCATRCPAT